MHMDTQFIFFIFAENDDFVKWLTENCGGVFYTVSRCAARTLWGLSNLVKWKGMERMKRRTARALCAAGLSLSLLAGLVPAMAAGPAEVADSLYINGNIYTVNEDFSTATTMAVKGDRILYVGDQAGAEAYVGAGTEITDLGGKTVLPGLIEGHMHVSNLGENHLKLDCYFKSKEDILEMVRQAAKEAEPGKLADFVVIDRDYMTCPEEEIKDIQALMTVSGGEVVYTKDTSEPTILWQGKPVTLLSGALIEQPGTIYASASDLAGNISAVLEQGEGTVTVTCGEQSAELPVKTVNGADYVPVRAFFEGIGYAVTWCPDSRTVSTSRMSTADTSEAAAQPPVDEYSFQLGNFDGTVGAFCDVIMTGAKELAFSDPFDPEDEPLLTSYVAKKCEGYGVKYYIDKDLLLTKLFSTVEMDGQWVYILYADDAVLQEYLELKQEEKDMIAAGTYTEKAQIDLATRYGKLMGYSDAHIAASIAGA